jgi:hypothetical protein
MAIAFFDLSIPVFRASTENTKMGEETVTAFMDRVLASPTSPSLDTCQRFQVSTIKERDLQLSQMVGRLKSVQVKSRMFNQDAEFTSRKKKAIP